MKAIDILYSYKVYSNLLNQLIIRNDENSIIRGISNKNIRNISLERKSSRWEMMMIVVKFKLCRKQQKVTEL